MRRCWKEVHSTHHRHSTLVIIPLQYFLVTDFRLTGRQGARGLQFPRLCALVLVASQAPAPVLQPPMSRASSSSDKDLKTSVPSFDSFPDAPPAFDSFPSSSTSERTDKRVRNSREHSESSDRERRHKHSHHDSSSRKKRRRLSPEDGIRQRDDRVDLPSKDRSRSSEDVRPLDVDLVRPEGGLQLRRLTEECGATREIPKRPLSQAIPILLYRSCSPQRPLERSQGRVPDLRHRRQRGSRGPQVRAALSGYDPKVSSQWM